MTSHKAGQEKFKSVWEDFFKPTFTYIIFLFIGCAIQAKFWHLTLIESSHELRKCFQSVTGAEFGRIAFVNKSVLQTKRQMRVYSQNMELPVLELYIRQNLFPFYKNQ